MSGRWQDRGGRRDRGAEEREADRRRRRGQEYERARLERGSSPQDITDEDTVIGEGPQLRRLPSVSPIDGLLAGMIEARGWGERLRGVTLEERWEDIVGPELARRTRPGRLVNGVLQVVVDSPQWATQVQYMTDQLIGRVTAETSLVVRRIVVVVGDVG